MQSDHFKKLQTERQKLDSLVDKALDRGVPILQTYNIMTHSVKLKRFAATGEALTGEEIITQSRKVDSLVVEAMREMEE